MACIVTTQSAIPEVFEAGTEFQPVHAGDTDDLYRQMKRMVDHPDWRARMGAAAREAVTACCTIEGATDRFRQIYASLQSRNESPAG
jgi:glycosyltransferase involved in cell wall biosynthesis